MANFITGAITIRIDRVKVGEATGGSYKVMNGVERVVTNDGVGFSNGKTVADIDFKTLVPRAGHRAALMGAVISKKNVTFQFNLDGQFHSVEGKMTTAGYQWDEAGGKCEGDFNFLGAEPTITG